MTLLKNWYYEKCIKFPVYYSKKAIQYSLSRVWLDASKILSKTKANSGKNSAGIGAAGVVQTLEWSGPCLPGWDGTAWLWAKASIKKNQTGKSSTKRTPGALPNSLLRVPDFGFSPSVLPLPAPRLSAHPHGDQSAASSVGIPVPRPPPLPFYGFLGALVGDALGPWCHVRTLGSVQPRELPCLLLERLFLGCARSPKRRQAATRYFLDMML